MKRAATRTATLLLIMTSSLGAQNAGAVYVADYIDVRSASANLGVALAAHYRRVTQADSGNASVYALQEIGRANRLVLIQNWRDHASFAAHEGGAQMLDFRNRLRAIERIPYDERIGHGLAIDPLPASASPNALYVVTHVDVPGARREEAEALLKQLFDSGRHDPGRVHYDIYQEDEPRPNHFTIIAVWETRRAFDAYGGSPHWRRFQEALTSMLGAPYDERLYKRIEGKEILSDR